MSAAGPNPAGGTPALPVSSRRRLPEWVAGYLYVLPALVVLLGFHLVPIGYALYISLFNWRIRQGPFIGAENYQSALANPDTWESLKVTVFYALGIIPAVLVLSFLIAYGLFQAIRGRAVYRLVYFLP